VSREGWVCIQIPEWAPAGRHIECGSRNVYPSSKKRTGKSSRRAIASRQCLSGVCLPVSPRPGL